MTKAIAKIHAPGLGSDQADTLGTAFAISEKLALTAFHCIGDCGSGEVKLTKVSLTFGGGLSLQATYVNGDHQADFALLELSTELPKTLELIALSLNVFPFSRFRATGYPIAVTGADQVTITGDVADPEGSILGGIRATQLSCTQSAAGLSLGGMSGAPVLVGTPAAAVGIVRWNPPSPDDWSRGVGGILFACPIKSVVERMPELSDYLQRTLTPTEQIKELLAIMNSMHDPSAAETLKRELQKVDRKRLLSEKFKPLASDWIPVPNFEYHFPKEPATSSREFVKHIFRVVAMGVKEIFPADVQEIQFALLCQFVEQEQGSYVGMVLPFQELVGFVLDHLPPRMKTEQLANLVGHDECDVYHKYALAPGIWTPVVVVYRPPLKVIELTNRNQIQHPDQFLTPHKCRTTSGFLNFLGTLLVETAKFKDAATKLLLFEKITDAMNQGLDQWFRWLYHFLDTGVVFDPGRLFVGSANAEEYYYDYYNEITWLC